MKILKQNKEEYLGNDCVIYIDTALIEAQRNYIVLKSEKCCGWSPGSDCNAKPFSDYNDACNYYNRLLRGE